MHFLSFNHPVGGFHRSKPDQQFYPRTQVSPPWRRLFFETTGHFEKDGSLVAANTGKVLHIPGQQQQQQRLQLTPTRKESSSLEGKIVPVAFKAPGATSFPSTSVEQRLVKKRRISKTPKKTSTNGGTSSSTSSSSRSSKPPSPNQKRLQDYGTRLTSKELLASAYQNLSDIISEHPSCYLIPGNSKQFDMSVLPYISQVKDDTATRESPIFQPDRLDVLLGRGGTTNYHFGNRTFRQLIALYRPIYCSLPKGHKAELAWNLTYYVRCQGGRFLTRAALDAAAVDGTTADGNVDAWYECGNERAQQKVAQGLREGTAGIVQEAIKTHLERV